MKKSKKLSFIQYLKIKHLTKKLNKRKECYIDILDNTPEIYNLYLLKNYLDDPALLLAMQEKNKNTRR